MMKPVSESALCRIGPQRFTPYHVRRYVHIGKLDWTRGYILTERPRGLLSVLKTVLRLLLH